MQVALIIALSLTSGVALTLRKQPTHPAVALKASKASQTLTYESQDALLFDHDDLFYVHNPKSGISTTEALLHVAIPENIDHQTAIAGFNRAQHESGMFTVSNVRNPCDYYVSLWTYNARHNRAGATNALRKMDPEAAKFLEVSEAGDTAEDISNFRSFMRAISGSPDNSVGVLTSRMAFQCFDTAGKGGWWSMKHPNADKDFMTQMRTHMADVTSKASSGVDCWVHTESIFPDVRACLKQFEKERKAKVNWEAFEQKVQDLEAKKKEKGLKRDGFNSEKHGACKAFFDKPTEELVRKQDDIIFDKFEYKTCCK